MNEILNKCLAELSQEKPNIDYVRGMLETLISLQPPSAAVKATVSEPAPQTVDPVFIEEQKVKAMLPHLEAMAALEG